MAATWPKRRLCLGLLISLIENRESSRQIMMSLQTNVMYTAESQPKTMSAIKAVVELFIWNEKEARHTAEFLNKSEDTYDYDESSEDDETCEDDETFTRARRHIQCSMVASFAAHLLRCTVTDNKEYAAVVKKFIPNNQFGPGIKMLKNLLSGDS